MRDLKRLAWLALSVALVNPFPAMALPSYLKPVDGSAALPKPTLAPRAKNKNMVAPRSFLPTQSVQGKIRVVVQFKEAPIAQYSKQQPLAQSAQRAYRKTLAQAQAPRLAQMKKLGAKIQGQMFAALNAAIIEVDASKLDRIRKIPGVISARPSGIFQLEQVTTSTTVGELIGSQAVQATGITGAGVIIAVIDSGIDYTHAAFGGPGTTQAYSRALANNTTIDDIGDDPSGTLDLLGPTAPKLLAGFDFLGETWTGSTGFGGLTVTPDPDPLDSFVNEGDFAAHGTWVSSAAAGLAITGLEAGSAPGAKLYVAKACSRITSACEGGALLQGIDFALDPNGDGDLSDRADVLNLSLGSAFGNASIDDLTDACRNAVVAGAVVVGSAGNNGDVPYITGSPAINETTISVAATEPPSQQLAQLQVVSPESIAGFYDLTQAEFSAPVVGTSTTELIYTGRACTSLGDTLLEDPTGNAGLVDRGDCAFVEKTAALRDAGATAAIIANNQPGIVIPAGELDPTIPTFSITQDVGDLLRSTILGGETVVVTVSEDNFIPLVDQIASFSSRGPGLVGNRIKPDIAAPGSLVPLAAVGTGTGFNLTSGTSFSSPYTAGTAALLLEKFPNFTPQQVKAALMNSATTTTFSSKGATDVLAPIARTGAGRVQVDRAATLESLAYDDTDPAKSASLSFGYVVVPADLDLTRTVRIENLTGAAKTYALSSEARFSDDATKGVIVSVLPDAITVPANSSGTFEVMIQINSDLLPGGGLDAGEGGIDSTQFTALEHDGFIKIDGGVNSTLTVPYLLLPRLASQVTVVDDSSTLSFSNTGATTGNANVFRLLATDPEDPTIPEVGSETQVVDLKEVGYRYTLDSSEDVVEFVASLYKPFTSPIEVLVQFDIDTNGDGITDFNVVNADRTVVDPTLSRGQNVVLVVNAATGAIVGFDFFTVADFNSGVLILPVKASTLGITADTPLGIKVLTFGGLTGQLSDQIPKLDLAAPFVNATGSVTTVTPAVDFTFEGIAGQQVFVESKGDLTSATPLEDIVLTVLAPDGSVVGSSDGAITIPDVEQVLATLAATGTYTIRIEGFQGALGDFIVTAQDNLGESFLASTPSAPVFVAGSTQIPVSPGVPVTIAYSTDPLNSAASASDQGFLILIKENGLGTESVAIQPTISPFLSVSTNQSTQAVNLGETASYFLEVVRFNAPGTASFGVRGLPLGATGSFDPQATTGNTTTLNVATVNTTPSAATRPTMPGCQSCEPAISTG